ncbi:serine hydrolase [Microbulbifer sp. SH-1]|uniref:serine hydrolase domain-containing protein n=1 Tax=Microbulbifer sp. SH-1 TaxID=2681547 RepID=UPI00140AF1AE|nr:serine hydrolase [Microbulbifer sp. SH-1]QIL89255.1 serine hydrolase [Microbulbifer sp. SH-1]
MEASIFLFATIFIVFAIAASLWVWRRRLVEGFQVLRDSLRTLLAFSAKLSCSARHISGFSDVRIRRDLVSYSPLLALVRIQHTGYTTSASLLNCIATHARFCPARGALLDDDPSAISGETGAGDIASETGRTPSACGYDKSLQTLLLALVDDDNRQGLNTRALLVMHEDRVMAAAYGAGVSPQTRLLGWSMSKSLLAILWGRMETLGLAAPDQCRLFPDWENDGRSAITLHNLLQMCDGLAFDEIYRPGADATRMLFCGSSNAPPHYAPSRYALERPLIHTPGTHFSYSSGTTNLLARWIHQRLGGTEAALHFLEQELLAPLGMHRTFFETDSEGIFVGSSYAFASAENWGRLGALMLNGGRAGGKQILSCDWIKRATEPNRSVNDTRYGYQFWLNLGGKLPPLYPNLPADSYFMLGNREQKLMLCPSHGVVIVRLGWSSRPYPAELRFGEILAQLGP